MPKDANVPSILAQSTKHFLVSSNDQGLFLFSVGTSDSVVFASYIELKLELESEPFVS